MIFHFRFFSSSDKSLATRKTDPLASNVQRQLKLSHSELWMEYRQEAFFFSLSRSGRERFQLAVFSGTRRLVDSLITHTKSEQHVIECAKKTIWFRDCHFRRGRCVRLGRFMWPQRRWEARRTVTVRCIVSARMGNEFNVELFFSNPFRFELLILHLTCRIFMRRNQRRSKPSCFLVDVMTRAAGSNG